MAIREAGKLPAGVRRLFEEKNFANVATIMPDGSPQVTPMWVEMENGNILLSSTESRVRTGNLRRDSRVAVSIFDQENPYKSAFIRGRVQFRKEGADEQIDRLAQKYLGEPEYPWRQPEDRRVTLVVRPEHVSTQGVE